MGTQMVSLGGDSGTSMQDAILAQYQASLGQVTSLNKSVKLNYDGLWNNYLINVASGQRDNSNPPPPPHAWVLDPAPPAHIEDLNYFVFYKIGDDPICPMPPIPPSVVPIDKTKLPKNNIVVGGSIGNGWFSVGPNDSWPVDIPTPPQADGHSYVKWGAPVGPGWYRQIS